MAYAFTGGGTGGHIYPCLAVAEAIHDKEPEAQLYYIGNPLKLEGKLLKGNDLLDAQSKPYSSYIKFLDIDAQSLPRCLNPITHIRWLINFIINIFIAKKYFKKFEIKKVFGTGGYISAPVFAACIFSKIPYIIHNLDANLGLANKVFVKDAEFLSLGLPINGLKKNKVLNFGNPVSKKFLNLNTEDKPKEKFELLITGGSQGAKSINDAIGLNLQNFSNFKNLNITHVTGPEVYKNYILEFMENDLEKYPNYKVLDYTHEMDKLCEKADFCICRSGAMTVAEMSISKVIPLFIPLPWAAHDHQNRNAEALVNSKAAFSFNQDLYSPLELGLELIKTLEHLMSHPDEISGIKEKLKNFSSPDTAEKLAKLVLERL